jgi:hypothetical protein
MRKSSSLYIERNFQIRHRRCVDRNITIGKMQSNTTVNICIAKMCLYIACLNSYMFQPVYRPSSGRTLSYYKAKYTIYNVFVVCQRDLVHVYKIFTLKVVSLLFLPILVTRHVCLSVRPSAWSNSALTGRIFMKFDIYISKIFHENSIFNKI